MMPYHAYQLHQTERAKSAAEIRRADLQLGQMAATVSRLRRRVTRVIAAGAALPSWPGSGAPRPAASAAPRGEVLAARVHARTRGGCAQDASPVA